ncbi:hypothetical protein GCM10027597_63630 [Saccharopolyspora tripterygii]
MVAERAVVKPPGTESGLQTGSSALISVLGLSRVIFLRALRIVLGRVHCNYSVVPLLGGAGSGTSDAFWVREPRLVYANTRHVGCPPQKTSENPRRCRLLGWGTEKPASPVA